MASVLFRFTHKNTDEVNASRRGDPIAAERNNWVWGDGEDKRQYLAKYGNTDGWHGNTVVIKIIGMSRERARKLIESDTRPANISDPEWNAPDAADRIVHLAKKRWRLRFAEMPQAWKNQLNTVGYLEVTLDQIRPYFRHRRSEEVVT